MSYVDMMLEDFRENPEAMEILKKHLPEMIEHSSFDRAGSFTLRFICGRPHIQEEFGITPERYQALEAELATLD